MLTILNYGQIFNWENSNNVTITDSIDIFMKSPSPKITLIDTAQNWYQFNHNVGDLTVYWSTEALANERAERVPIIKFHPNDRVFSSSSGPNNKYNLLFWLNFIQHFYTTKYKYLIPKNEIFANNICCTLGDGRLTRIYAYLQLLNHELLNRNVSFATNSFMPSLMPDDCNELVEQNKMLEYVQKNRDCYEYKPLELDWNKTKNLRRWYSQHLPGVQSSAIIPTKAYLDSSLIFINETIVHNPEFFVTEKTAKGILSGRPFIVVGCHKFLEQLRNLGFLTWSSVLDESYDEKESIKERIDFAVLSAKEFKKSNVLNSPTKLALIQKISNHNREVFFNTNWSEKMRLAKKQIYLELGLPI